MTPPGGPSTTDRLAAELEALRSELAELRNEQREMARSIQELVVTFRSLAVQLGIAAEPYAKKQAKSQSTREVPGFA